MEIKLPFSVNRNQPANLPDQVADGFRQAIRSGFYRPGDVLPSRGEIAKALGISVRVPREAMHILADESLVRPRRGVGCTVLAPRDTLWRGRVLIIERAICAGSHYAAMMMAALRRDLFRSGYLCTTISVEMKRNGRDIDLVPVEEALRQPMDFAFAMYPTAGLARYLRGRIPFLCHGGECDESEKVKMLREPSRTALIELCRERGVRRILFAGYGNNGWELEMFRSAGIDVEDVSLHNNNRHGYLSAIEMKSFDLFRKRLSSRKTLPDLVYFADDYVARGGLSALLSLGVEIPGRVKIVAATNRGFAPVFPVSLAQLESDPVHNGRFIAECVAARLERRPLPAAVSNVHYIPGDTFP